jgi:hypothetical protein
MKQAPLIVFLPLALVVVPSISRAQNTPQPPELAHSGLKGLSVQRLEVLICPV